MPLPGGLTAFYDSNGLGLYYFVDWLGSVRLLEWPNRVALPMMAYAAFGEGYGTSTPNDDEFTAGGYALTVLQPENQGGTLDDFMFRRYNATQGRWISPDPAGLAAVDPTNPQSWNRYAYVANNPLSFVDPSGLVYLYAEPPGGDAARNAFLYNHFLGDAGDGAGGGFGFSLNGFFNGMCNDFMPCGAAPTSLGQVFQSVWSDALGLPTNLNCPVVGGLSNYLCGGVSPIMDAEPNALSALTDPVRNWWDNILSGLQSASQTGNQVSCDFMTAGVQTGNGAVAAGETVAGAATTVTTATFGKFGSGAVATGGFYSLFGKGYASFWKGMKYLGGCNAYGR